LSYVKKAKSLLSLSARRKTSSSSRIVGVMSPVIPQPSKSEDLFYFYTRLMTKALSTRRFGGKVAPSSPT